MLLSDLYLRALKVLEQGDREGSPIPARRLATVKAGVRETLLSASAPEADVAAFLDEMARSLLLHRARRRHPAAFRSDALTRRSGPLVCRVRHFPELGVQRVHRRDARPAGLFSMIAGAADRQQSQHPLGANHHAHQRRCDGRLSHLASDGRRSRWRSRTTAGSASSTTSSASSTGQQDIAALVAAAHHVQSAGPQVRAPRTDRSHR